MKKVLILLVILFPALGSIAQKADSLRSGTSLQVQRITRTIPANRAILVRKDISKLKLQFSQLRDSVNITNKEIDEILASMKNDLNSTSEMGETESLRLQMAMDRLSKLMSTLSNLLKKASEASQAITQNIK